MEMNQVAGADSDLKKLFTTVVDGGYCIGCGACATVPGSPVKIKLDESKMLKASVPDNIDLNSYNGSYQQVCPFSDKSKNEYEIGKDLFGKLPYYNDKIGFYQSSYAGHVVEKGFRDRGSSGGMGSWIGYTLFKKGLVDGVINIQKKTHTDEDPRLFHFQLSTSVESIMGGAKSRYYPIEMSDILEQIKELPGRYAIVGVPCFLKAIRLLSDNDPVLKEKIAFCIGLVCGHLKSAAFAEMFAWQCGMKPGELRAIDFRTKLKGKKSSQYGVTVEGVINGEKEVITSGPVDTLYGTNWGHGYFKYKACDFCDDVVAETADVTVGDAWLPRYVNDDQGTNIVIVRNSVIQGIIDEAIAEKKLNFDNVTENEVIASQKSGFEHRRSGLAYRLYLTDLKGIWRPQKRIEADGTSLSPKIKLRQEYRVKLAEKSHEAFNSAIKSGSFDIFKSEMKPLLQVYNNLYKLPLLQRVYNKIKWICLDILKR
jgi:coenzyme F420 hydrogenase subunit beta